MGFWGFTYPFILAIKAFGVWPISISYNLSGIFSTPWIRSVFWGIRDHVYLFIYIPHNHYNFSMLCFSPSKVIIHISPLIMVSR